MKYKLLALILLTLCILTQLSIASPIIGIDENISEDSFYSHSYTNPDSIEAHQIIAYSEDGEHSQINLAQKFTPRTTTSPDGNYSVVLRWIGAHDEDFFISNTITGNDTNIKNIITTGYYPVAFSPDSKMYAAPRVVFSEDCRNGQYVIDICSVNNNTVLHRELLHFYIESTRENPMEWDRAAIYEVYWSNDGNSIVYEALGANIDGGRYPTYLIINRLNVDYTELRRMNGYVELEQDPEPIIVQEYIEEIDEPNAVESSPTPGFELAGALLALALNRKMKRT
ncbi:TolB-like translocation protein [Methanolobus profundi]|uniref:Uncharacterized protein n=1 Tax=Methanolobus profundi TaxID=487685 RepID=A0A1I4T9H3_9EURY|nr:hypothetical protein [Methanolobus profundi]SFM73336.1 hypothetical protein SAMN04488696_2263 [Methanolobus profundi]